LSITVTLPWSRSKKEPAQSVDIVTTITDPDPYVVQLQKLIALCKCDPRKAYRSHLRVGMEVLEEELSPIHCKMVADLQAECERELASLRS
jgi:hypothetical protein